MVNDDAQSNSRETWSGEGRSDQHPNHITRQGWTRATSLTPGNIGLGTVGEGGKENPVDFQFALVGGILAQLIAQTEDQLGTAEECIAWYEREKAKYQTQLANLRHLYELGRQSLENSLEDQG